MKNKLTKVLALPVALATGLNASSQSDAVKNVLFIAVDDMNTDLGCYGNQLVRSPNIDRLASRGVAFTNAYCQFPLSSPSRSSVLTGLRPDRTRVFNLTYHFRQDQPDLITLPQMFINNGYYVARVGKIYHYGNPGEIGTNGLDDRISWMERVNPAGADKTSLEEDIINYTPARGLGSSMSFLSDSLFTDRAHTDGKVADETIKLLSRHRDKPFFIAAGFYRPHCPWVTPEKFFELYDPEQFSLPEISEKTRGAYPVSALASTNPWPYFGISREQALECKLAYYASISFVDAQIGRVLDALDSLGLAENTIIVFWSDHGYHLGEHGLWFKQSCFEESAKTPLIIVDPSAVKTAGLRCRKPVELIDIYPTLAGLAGLTPPPYVQGNSLLPLIGNPEMQWDHPAYTQVQRGEYPGHSVRTSEWRYTEWGFGAQGTELYDETSDPRELNNLASNPAYSDVVKRMKLLLEKVHPTEVKGGIARPDTKKLFCN